MKSSARIRSMVAASFFSTAAWYWVSRAATAFLSSSADAFTHVTPIVAMRASVKYAVRNDVFIFVSIEVGVVAAVPSLRGLDSFRKRIFWRRRVCVRTWVVPPLRAGSLGLICRRPRSDGFLSPPGYDTNSPWHNPNIQKQKSQG